MDESQQPPKRQRRDRLIALIEHLRNAELHLGRDLARSLGVSERTIYRDMEVLKKSGIPVTGTRGSGYQMAEEITLPPMNLAMQELEALHLGIAVMAEASDPTLAKSAQSLAAKIDAALPEGRISDNMGWGLAVLPFADPAAGVQHMPELRRAIRGQHRVRLRYRSSGGVNEFLLRPLQLDYWGRVWTCLARMEPGGAERGLRLDRIEDLTVLGGSE